MKNLVKLAKECEADLISIGVQPGVVSLWTVNTRAKKRWGQCRRDGGGYFVISISSRLLADEVDVQATKNTIMHELIHTVNGCHGHTGLWAEIAAKVNRRLPQYTIKRTTSSAEKGIEEAARERTNRYAIQCICCGHEYTREKMTKVIQHPENYRCSHCGGRLERVR